MSLDLKDLQTGIFQPTMLDIQKVVKKFNPDSVFPNGYITDCFNYYLRDGMAGLNKSYPRNRVVQEYVKVLGELDTFMSTVSEKFIPLLKYSLLNHVQTGDQSTLKDTLIIGESWITSDKNFSKIITGDRCSSLEHVFIERDGSYKSSNFSIDAPLTEVFSAKAKCEELLKVVPMLNERAIFLNVDSLGLGVKTNNYVYLEGLDVKASFVEDVEGLTYVDKDLMVSVRSKMHGIITKEQLDTLENIVKIYRDLVQIIYSYNPIKTIIFICYSNVLGDFQNTIQELYPDSTIVKYPLI